MTHFAVDMAIVFKTSCGSSATTQSPVSCTVTPPLDENMTSIVVPVVGFQQMILSPAVCADDILWTVLVERVYTPSAI